MWNLNGSPSSSGGAQTTHLQYRHDHHKEFVTDVEWCMDPANPLDVASCSWDGTVALWKLGAALSM
jgi:WD40 repeat protein